jgi:hypothetical protein
MAIPRERTSISTRNGGTCGRFTWWPADGPGVQVNSGLNFARDSVGPEDDYPLDFDRQELSGGTMNQAYSGYFSSWFNNWVPEILRAGFNITHLATGTAAFDSYYATQIAARTNPSRPYVDLAAELLQLPELAHILRNAGPGLARQAGSAYLTTSFGIQPVGGVIARLINSHRVISERVNEIKRLAAYGIRRTMTMDFSSASSRDYRYIDTAHSTAGGWFDTTTIEEVRAHIRWGLYPGALDGLVTPAAIDAQIRSWATQAVRGQTIDLSTVYQLTPWTWLLDWFASTGDYLKATRNIVPAILKEVVVMRHCKTVSSYPGESYDPGGAARMHIAPIRMTRESKSRRFSFISPFTGHLPFLENRQMATLASLAVTR